jgi:hypothetical protein
MPAVVELLVEQYTYVILHLMVHIQLLLALADNGRSCFKNGANNSGTAGRASM